MRPYHRSYRLIAVSKFLKKDRVVDLTSTTKREALDELVHVLCKSLAGAISCDELLKAILDRETKITTGVGVGVAIPHARLASAADFAIAIGRCKAGVDYDSFDGGLVHLLFLVVSPPQAYERYLNIHAKIALLLSNEEFRNRLLAAKDSLEIYRLMKGK
jgi:mannitol/fructose-specific phosphotransferase system IIA component (Ntr-type)